MKKVKYILIILVGFLLLSNIKVNALNLESKVYDYALILTDKEEEKLNNKIKEYTEKNNIKLLFLTVKHHALDTTEEYLNEFYKKNLDGDVILVVIDLTDNKRNIDIKSFKNAKRLCNDNKIKSILSSHKIKSKINNYKISNILLNEIISEKQYGVNDKGINYLKYLLLLIPGIVISSIIVILLLFQDKDKKIEEIEYSYLNINSLSIDKRLDKFVTTHTKYSIKKKNK